MLQKLNYIHLNPVRAGLSKHPAEWKWSSYRAYLPHEPGSVPIEIDARGYWAEDEFEIDGCGGGQRPPLNDQCELKRRATSASKRDH